MREPSGDQTGEPLPEAEKMYREALRFPRRNDPLFASRVNSRIGMLRLRQGDMVEGERVLRDADGIAARLGKRARRRGGRPPGPERSRASLRQLFRGASIRD